MWKRSQPPPYTCSGGARLLADVTGRKEGATDAHAEFWWVGCRDFDPEASRMRILNMIVGRTIVQNDLDGRIRSVNSSHIEIRKRKLAAVARRNVVAMKQTTSVVLAINHSSDLHFIRAGICVPAQAPPMLLYLR